MIARTASIALGHQTVAGAVVVAHGGDDDTAGSGHLGLHAEVGSGSHAREGADGTHGLLFEFVDHRLAVELILIAGGIGTHGEDALGGAAHLADGAHEGRGLAVALDVEVGKVEIGVVGPEVDGSLTAGDNLQGQRIVGAYTGERRLQAQVELAVHRVFLPCRLHLSRDIGREGGRGRPAFRAIRRLEERLDEHGGLLAMVEGVEGHEAQVEDEAGRCPDIDFASGIVLGQSETEVDKGAQRLLGFRGESAVEVERAAPIVARGTHDEFALVLHGVGQAVEG